MASFFETLGWGKASWGYQLLIGAITTVEISVGAFVVGLVIGTLVAWVKLSGGRISVTLANVYSTVCRSVPEVLLIIILFYAGQSALTELLVALGAAEDDIAISGFAAAIIVLGLVQGAYASEIIRGAILAIPKGQLEAASAYGIEGIGRFRRIVLPVMLPLALGGLSNLWMAIIKDSALISVVGYNELLFATKQAAGSTKQYFAFFLFAAAVYYAITLVSNLLLSRLERRIGRWAPRAN